MLHDNYCSVSVLNARDRQGKLWLLEFSYIDNLLKQAFAENTSVNALILL